MTEGLFVDALKTIQPLVWSIVQTYLPQREPAGHYEMIREYPQRLGKYVRPGLLLLGNELFGGMRDKTLRTAAAMQLSEEWLLVHDDIEDHSEVRRRTAEALNPTLNVLYGDELAINAGDALHIIMWKAVSDAAYELGEPLGRQLFDKMNDILLTTTEGQFMELHWIREAIIKVSSEEYYQMIDRKAGYYTITGPLQLGAMIAGAKPEAVQAIKSWGIPFGRAFQIWDDVLNVDETDAVSGKERGGDILEGKRTLLLAHLLEACDSTERTYLTTLYRKPRAEKTYRDAEYVIDLMEHYGSIAYAKGNAEKFAMFATEQFLLATQSFAHTPAKDCLADAIRFVVARRR